MLYRREPCRIPDDRVTEFLAQELAHGGHLTHGSPVTMSGKWFDVVSYEVRKDTHLIDMDALRREAQKLCGAHPIEALRRTPNLCRGG